MSETAAGQGELWLGPAFRLEYVHSHRAAEGKSREAGALGRRVDPESNQGRQSLAMDACADGVIALEQFEGVVVGRAGWIHRKHSQDIELGDLVRWTQPHRRRAGKKGIDR